MPTKRDIARSVDPGEPISKPEARAKFALRARAWKRPPSDPEMSDGAGPWLSFVVVLDELIRHSGWSLDRAFHELGCKGGSGEIPVRCLASHLPKGHQSYRQNTRHMYGTEYNEKYLPEHDFVHIAEWLTWHPEGIREERVHSEWRKAEFDAWIASIPPSVRTAPVAQITGKSRKGVGGPMPNDEWFGVMVEVGAWLATETGPHKPGDVVKFIRARFAARGLDGPEKTELYRRANQALGSFRSWQSSSGN